MSLKLVKHYMAVHQGYGSSHGYGAFFTAQTNYQKDLSPAQQKAFQERQRAFVRARQAFIANRDPALAEILAQNLHREITAFEGMKSDLGMPNPADYGLANPMDTTKVATDDLKAASQSYMQTAAPAA